MEQKTCLNCGKELKQEQGKREKKFCNSTCRSNFWQKTHRPKKEKLKEGVIYEFKNGKLIEIERLIKTEKQGFDLSAPKGKPFIFVMPQKDDEKPPERKQGESSLDYRIRYAEWRESINK